MDMYTKPVDRASLAVPPVLTLEARPTRVSCAALFLILVRTNWSGRSASRGNHGRMLDCAHFSSFPCGAAHLAPECKRLAVMEKTSVPTDLFGLQTSGLM